MPVFKTGDMWSVFNDVDYFVITTNSFVKNNGALVMGRGIAQQVRDRFPGIDKEAGQSIRRVCRHLGIYYLLMGEKFGLFQVKTNFMDKASPTLIRGAARQLEMQARANPDKTYALNFPGIGNGGLPYETVKPLLMDLPDNVQIWTYQ